MLRRSVRAERFAEASLTARDFFGTDPFEGAEKLGQFKRLGQRGGEAGLGHLLLLAAADVSRGGDHRDFPQTFLGPQQAQQIVAVFSRHPDVRDDNVGQFRPHGLQRLLGGGRLADAQSLG